MLILLSPAKSLDTSRTLNSSDFTTPELLERSVPLVASLRKKSVKKLQDLMSISQPLAELNKGRYESFSTPFTSKNANPALALFTGDVYQGLDATSLSKSDLKFAQQSVRILSGLYGILKPMDLIQPYRLEMGTKLPYRKNKNLYEYWDSDIAENINADLKEQDFIVNLASKEYFKAVKPKMVEAPIYNIDFKEYKNGKLTFISFNAKKARGIMTKWLILNRVSLPAQLKDFDSERYQFDPALSTETTLVFTRDFIPVNG